MKEYSRFVRSGNYLKKKKKETTNFLKKGIKKYNTKKKKKVIWNPSQSCKKFQHDSFRNVMGSRVKWNRENIKF